MSSAPIEIYTLSLHDALPISGFLAPAVELRDRHQLRTALRDEQCAASLRAVHLVPCQRSEEHTSELQSRRDLVCRLLLEKKKHAVKQYNNLRNVITRLQTIFD